ncbi:MAG: hypothetical protein J2P48_14610, partial [Alphaproteobacteria bacterium]|nr:hypothetical protein [Alphaproteobacteria bacterium]
MLKSTLAHRHRETGTTHALYAAADDYKAIIRDQTGLLEALAAQLRAGADIVRSIKASAGLPEVAGSSPGSRRVLSRKSQGPLPEV